tara:strand:+ start:359 stop:691 length:333 start_codon:yes stop_codon:yes gene_type:complete
MVQKKLQKDSNYNDLDVNKDGIISDEEIESWQLKEEVERANRKQRQQRYMAWTAMASMVAFTAVILSPLIPDSKLELMATLLSTFYIAQAGVVGAFMGFAAFDKSGVRGK